jgi:hypothetical protein
VKPPVVSESEAQKASRRLRVWKSGWYDGRIDDAREMLSKAGNDCFELSVIVRDAAGAERTLRDWPNATSFGLLKLKHAIEAVGASGKYSAGEEISQDDFPGHDVQVKIGIEKKRGFPDRNVIEDYRAASSSVVALRSAG